MYQFYGQHDEDKYIFNTFFKDKKDGFFVELGAIDGVTFSNTLFFEKNMGWKGILIEPWRAEYDKLVRNRPHSKCYNCAITREEGTATMLNLGHSAMNRIEGKVVTGNNAIQDKKTVPTLPMGKLLHDANVQHIDFFSIDVEGSEEDVLLTMDWDIPVHVILAEIKNRVSSLAPKNKICREILKDKGFIYHSSTRTDEVWIHPNFKEENK